MYKKLFKISFLSILLIVIIWIVCIAKCEYITMQHLEEFESIEEIKNANKTKILLYSDNYAEIYCTSMAQYNNNSYVSGNKYSFNLKNGRWICCGWDTIWSESGGADGFVWPYIR